MPSDAAKAIGEVSRVSVDFGARSVDVRHHHCQGGSREKFVKVEVLDWLNVFASARSSLNLGACEGKQH